MAINKNDYLDGNGDYDLKKELVDEVIDGVNTLINPTTTTINTFENGWEGSLTFSRYGDLVSIKGTFQKTGTTTFSTQLTVIPVGFRPTSITPIGVSKADTSPYDSSFLFWIRNDGRFVLQTTETIPANRSGAALGINQIYSV